MRKNTILVIALAPLLILSAAAQASTTAAPKCAFDPGSPHIQTQTLSCPIGQVGTITLSRTSPCVFGATPPKWSTWTTTSNTCVTSAVGMPDMTVKSIKLQDYLPKTYTDSVYVNTWGGFGSEIVWFPAGGLQPYYDKILDIGVPGRTMVKEQIYPYPKPTDRCLFEYDFWQLGNDGSVTEAGSWGAGGCSPFNGGGGYRTIVAPIENTGLTYSGPGTLTNSGVQNFNITNSLDTAAYKYGVYSISRLEAFFPQWKPAYGRDIKGAWVAGGGNVYYNVAEITLWHGTTAGQDIPTTRCTDKISTVNPLTAYYMPIPNYDSYAQRFWYAPGKGVIQSQILYFEAGGNSCQGAIFGSTPQEAQANVDTWTAYIDEPFIKKTFGLIEVQH